MNSNQLRQAFLMYFKDNAHQILPGSSLIPANDPTLLFTNAGMVQFKDYFLGREAAPYPRIATAQACVRAGGKHNDLDNVGYTARHHTFFEMLGNFSFNSYFKKEAIEFAWKFLTQVLKIPSEKLWVTVYQDDDETADLWVNHMGVDPNRLSRCGAEDNFWSMGDTGPCGPCTEIFYDHGPEVLGGPPGSPTGDADRYIEVWNLVFMQFNRAADGSMSPLPNPCVDTGMGFERMAAVLQGVHNNYEIDLFQYLLKALSDIIHFSDTKDTSMRVIVDHIRSSSFLIMDGVVPSNEGRGYVLRRIIRRALRHGHRLNQMEPFFYRLVPALTQIMGEAYPNLIKAQARIEDVLLQEEEQFALTLSKGMKLFEQALKQLKTKTIPGEIVFQLYDTYGFPPDLTADIARERNLSIDEAGFEALMNKQRQQSQQAKQFAVDYNQSIDFKTPTQFIGYETQAGEVTVLSLLKEQGAVNEIKPGEKAIVILNQTPFYAESGGQVGDKGHFESEEAYFTVFDTKKQGEVYLHQGELIRGHLKLGDHLKAKVDDSRQAIRLNHSATHLLHAALKKVLGEHVVQKGSLVEADRLRFDFAHPKALSSEQLRVLEHLVNEQIRMNTSVQLNEMDIEKAKASGAEALFGEKYGAKVRVVSMGDFSNELCGGTHVNRTGDIGLFRIISESASAAGIRRIEAVTGDAALNWQEAQELKFKQELEATTERTRALEKQITQFKQKLVAQQFDELLVQAQEVDGYAILAVSLGEIEIEFLRNMLDRLRERLGLSAIVLASVLNHKVQLVSGVSPEMLKFFNATELLNQVAHPLGGKGGGRPELAQGGAEQSEKLGMALASVYSWAKEKIVGESTRK